MFLLWATCLVQATEKNISYKKSNFCKSIYSEKWKMNFKNECLKWKGQAKSTKKRFAFHPQGNPIKNVWPTWIMYYWKKCMRMSNIDLVSKLLFSFKYQSRLLPPEVEFISSNKETRNWQKCEHRNGALTPTLVEHLK